MSDMDMDDLAGGGLSHSTIELLARKVAREEIASLAGLVLRRLQLQAALAEGETRDLVETKELASIFGEALRDFGGTTTEPGEE